LAKPSEYPLYTNVRNVSSLTAAWRVVRENGLSSPSQRTGNEIKAFDAQAFGRIPEVSRSLAKGQFRFSPSRGVLIPKPGKDPRPIVQTSTENRIGQRSILDALLDALQSVHDLTPYYLNKGSYGGLKGLGVPEALAAVYRTIINNGTKFYVRSDIKDFFRHVPRESLLKKIEEVVTDRKFLRLLDKATTVELSNVSDLGRYADDFPTYSLGVAQGFCLSPLMGNILLKDFDSTMNDRGIACIRYIDDFILLGPTQKKVQKAFNSAKKILGSYGLAIHDPCVPGAKAEMGFVSKGFQFLGCEFMPGKIRPSRDARDKLIDALGLLFKGSIAVMTNPLKTQQEKQSYLETLYDPGNVIRGWGNQYSFCNADEEFQVLDSKIDKLLSEYSRSYAQAVAKLASNDLSRSKRRLLGLPLLLDCKKSPIIIPEIRPKATSDPDVHEA
jgi:RNA-directed DNA polymerase